MGNECHMFFEALGTKLKIDILAMLKKGHCSVNELSKGLCEERSKVSHALKSLLECRFVVVRKRGRSRIYSLNADTILPLLGMVERHVKKYCKVCRKVRS